MKKIKILFFYNTRKLFYYNILSFYCVKFFCSQKIKKKRIKRFRCSQVKFRLLHISVLDWTNFMLCQRCVFSLCLFVFYSEHYWTLSFCALLRCCVCSSQLCRLQRRNFCRWQHCRNEHWKVVVIAADATLSQK